MACPCRKRDPLPSTLAGCCAACDEGAPCSGPRPLPPTGAELTAAWRAGVDWRAVTDGGVVEASKEPRLQLLPGDVVVAGRQASPAISLLDGYLGGARLAAPRVKGSVICDALPEWVPGRGAVVGACRLAIGERDLTDVCGAVPGAVRDAFAGFGLDVDEVCRTALARGAGAGGVDVSPGNLPACGAPDLSDPFDLGALLGPVIGCERTVNQHGQPGSRYQVRGAVDQVGARVRLGSAAVQPFLVRGSGVQADGTVTATITAPSRPGLEYSVRVSAYGPGESLVTVTERPDSRPGAQASAAGSGGGGLLPLAAGLALLAAVAS